MLVLGIESTCDEAAAAVVEDGSKILSNIVYSQAQLHNQFKGVVPELACRKHLDVIIPVVEQALKKANCSLEDIDVIAAARGPGLIGALLIGLNTAKALAYAAKKPFIGINHLEGHLYGSMMPVMPKKFPCLGVILSGGHTALVHIEAIRKYRVLGTTVDDAIGEAFDKVASLLGLPYPGGPFIENLARDGDPYKFSFKAGNVKKNPLDFSFSGLKTNVMYTIKGQNQDKNAPSNLSDIEKKDIAASFQRAAFSDIVNKTLLATDHYPYHGLILGGGVCSSQALKKMFEEAFTTIPQFWPATGMASDNAAMIAGLGYHQFMQQGQHDSYFLKAQPKIPNLM
ncbi:MAG: tRNA N6-adenosine threonylcarbamoyltransferase [Chlamydiae bacterium]|nr:tRNA N6-adenosine threonylcarbamoyltransferase [Chlamydiota bacterium]